MLKVTENPTQNSLHDKGDCSSKKKQEAGQTSGLLDAEAVDYSGFASLGLCGLGQGPHPKSASP